MATTTVTVDKELLSVAREYTSGADNESLVREALNTFIQIQAGLKLIALGGSQPEIEDIPRRRMPAC